MNIFNRLLTITLTLFFLQSCLNSSPNSDEYKKTLQELEDAQNSGIGEIQESQGTKELKATENVDAQKFCDYLLRLPENRNRKETYALIDSILPLLAKGIDPDCACTVETHYTRAGARIPILKHFFKTKTKRGKENA